VCYQEDVLFCNRSMELNIKSFLLASHI
jgi:hypothetical protein